MNKENLLKLADHLENNVTQNEFNMNFYRSDGFDEIDFKSYNDCGTIGCALGHAPFVEGLEPIETDYYEDYLGYLCLDFRTYGDRLFNLKRNCFDWCFTCAWRDIDNTPKGAAKRIKYLVEHGLPSDCYEQLYREKDYIFKDEVNDA